MSFHDKRRARAMVGQKAAHRNPQLLRPGRRQPGDRRRAELAQKLAIEKRMENGRAESNGRKPMLLNDALEKRICDHLRQGASFDDAAVLSGIGSKTISTWRHKGTEDPDSRFGLFLERTELARLEFKTRMIRKVAEATDWKGAWRILVSRWPLEYRNHVSTELSGPDGSPISLAGSGSFNVVLELSGQSEDQSDAALDERFKIV